MACRKILIAISLAGVVLWHVQALAQNDSPATQTPPEAARPDVIDLLNPPKAEPALVPNSNLPGIKFPHFATCSLAELQKEIPELQTLKAGADQSNLPSLLDKIGARVVEMARGTPNLISDESVVSEHGGVSSRQNFSFLTVQHASKSSMIVFDEFRVDPKSGEKFETQFLESSAENREPSGSDAGSLDLPSGKVMPETGETPPHSQGFASQWLNFYPANRSTLDFRYLGEQEIYGRHTLVVVFAQKPGIFPMPLTIDDQFRVYKVFMQGIAWVDSTDFRIAHIRSGILSSPPGSLLRQFNVDVDFGEVHVATLNSGFWLPNRVVVNSNLANFAQRETHTYSNYRLFRAKSRILLNP